MEVFLSWSGDRSKAIASFLRFWLPRVIQNCRPWLSDRDIEKGQKWSEMIGKSLSDHSFGIICVTPENYRAPWLLFEAGALSKSLGESRVCPLLFGMSCDELSGPLAQFQATVIEKDDVLELLKTVNAQMKDLALDQSILIDAYSRFWPDFESELQGIGKIEIPGSRAKIDRVVKSFSKHGLPEPVIGSEAYFKSGFESHGLYTSVMETAKKRLYVFGRKNRKVFDKEHKDFFVSLSSKIAEGFDFRVMFLDPDSPEHVLRSAHLDGDFQDQLQECISRAKRTLANAGINAHDHCRLYSVNRTTSIVAVDDAVAFSPIRLDGAGRAEKLTKAAFTIVNSTSDFGEELLKMFETQWSSARSVE